jgi:hypothetical protein
MIQRNRVKFGLKLEVDTRDAKERLYDGLEALIHLPLSKLYQALIILHVVRENLPEDGLSGAHVVNLCERGFVDLRERILFYEKPISVFSKVLQKHLSSLSEDNEKFYGHRTARKQNAFKALFTFLFLETRFSYWLEKFVAVNMGNSEEVKGTKFACEQWLHTLNISGLNTVASIQHNKMSIGQYIKKAQKKMLKTGGSVYKIIEKDRLQIIQSLPLCLSRGDTKAAFIVAWACGWAIWQTKRFVRKPKIRKTCML